MDCQICDNKIYECLLNGAYMIEWGVEPLVGWAHAAVPDADNPIEVAIRLDTDHTPTPY